MRVKPALALASACADRGFCRMTVLELCALRSWLCDCVVLSLTLTAVVVEPKANDICETRPESQSLGCGGVAPEISFLGY